MGSPSIFASAIGQAEGYGVPGAIPTLANNPGDLKLGDVGGGTMGSGITVFGSAEEGWAALENQLSKITGGSSAYYGPQMTISQMGQVWAGGDPNWANNVSQALGTNPSAAIGNYLPGGQNESGQAAIPSLPGWDYNALPGQSSQSEAQGAGGAVGTGTSGAGDSSLWGRIAAGLVGLICIGGGVMMFRQSQVIIQNVAGAAKKAAALAAALFLALALGLGSSSAAGQNTTAVTATLTDSDGQAWVNCSWGADLFNPSGGQQPIYTNTGQPVPVHISGQMCDGTGSLSYAIPDNNKITPIGTRWVFTLQSNTSAPPTVTNNILVTGASMNLTANLSGQLVAPRFNPGSEKRGYLDAEVLNPQQGSQYYNVINLVGRVFDGTKWNNNGGGGLSGVTPFGTATYGDSTVYGVGASTPAYIFGQQLQLYIPGQWQNFGISGYYTQDVASRVWQTWAPTNVFAMPYVSYEGGVNDANFIGNTPGGINNATLAVMAGARHVAVPIANQGMASLCTSSGWAAYTNTTYLPLPVSPGTNVQFQTGTMMQTSTSGATLTCTIMAGSSGKIGVTWLGDDAATGTFTIAINGTLQTSLCSGTTTFAQGGCNGQTISRNGGFSPFAQEFSGTPNTSNTVVITATNTGLNLMMDIDAMPTAQAGSPIVGMQGVLREQSDTNSAATAAYNTVVSNVAAVLNAENSNVVFIDVRNGKPGVNITTDYGGVGCAGGVAPLHLADCGYQNLVLTHINALQAAGLKVGAANLGTQRYTPLGSFTSWVATLPPTTATNPYLNDFHVNLSGIVSATLKMPGICMLWTGTACSDRMAVEYSTTFSSYALKVLSNHPTIMCNSSPTALDLNCGFIFWNGAVGQGAITPLHIGWTGNYNTPTNASGGGLELDSQKVVTSGTTTIATMVNYVAPGTYSPIQCIGGIYNYTQFYWATSAGNFTFTKTYAGDTINGSSTGVTFNNVPANSLFIMQCSVTASPGITVTSIPQNSGTAFGMATLVSGTVTVSTAAACTPSTSCVYKLTHCGISTSSAIGVLSTGPVVAGTSFVITSFSSTLTTVTTDVSNVCWQIN